MMRCIAYVAIGALGALGAAPAMPAEYTAVILMKMPYIPLEMPLRVLTSASAQKVDYYDGLQVITSSATGSFQFVYNNSERVCIFTPPTAGPTQKLGAVEAFTSAAFLPDLSTYTQVADENVGGIMTQKFTLKAAHGTTHTMDDQYDFYWDPILEKPVRWHMHARLVPFGSHTDEYILDFIEFQAGTPTAGDLALPKLCQEKPTEARVSSGMGNFLKVAAKNMLAVDELNQKHAGVTTFKANRFMGMTKEEIMSFRGGKNKGSSKQRRSAEHQKYVRTYKKVGTSAPPTDFDWRIAKPGSVSPVKDQAFCGSCWAYGGVEPIESMLALSTKSNLVVLPEQFMMDCTWTNNTGDSGTNSGCGGGDSDIGALEIVRKYGGVIPTAEAYGSYLGVNGYCKDIKTMAVGAKITGWTDITERDDDALMEALATKGPVNVNIQVPQDMLYYDTGVLNTAQCQYNASEIDHAVVAVGYGTQPGLLGKPDQDYWMVRNSWSTYWGDQGYIKIARGKWDCCVSCEAGYADIAPAAASVIV